MAAPILLFGTGLLRRWWAMMSCAAFTALSVYAAATNKANSWVVAGSAVLAVLFFLIAAYLTWKDEHDGYIQEVERNQKPEIQGELSIVGYGAEFGGHEYGDWSVSQEVSLRLKLCNHRPVDTTLEDLEWDGSQLNPPVVFDDGVKSMHSNPIGESLPYGIGITIDVGFVANINDVKWEDIDPIDLAPFKFYVVDAFQQRHRIKIKPGERLFERRRKSSATSPKPA